MPKAKIYNQEGENTGELELKAEIFGVEIKPALVHEAVIAQQANARTTSGHTKTRGEVRGGGKKPWKQKGTGRARHGSIRSPIWVGGGITHGPRKEKNFSVKINRKAKKQAMFMALSDKVTDEKMLVLERPDFKEVKTKFVAEMLKKLPVGRRILFVIPKSNPSLLRMVRNIPNVRLVTVNTLNLVDVVSFPTILFQKDAVTEFESMHQKAKS
ncbi:MAG: 50S ribosomal protein L4 [Patescibacteria group bacterium]|nr:50S ribosomal protein L4 [Patescibacteria group bacterium]MBU2509480.1 50S ribosomal protein L4 [Patescibacteria group bacterium]